MGFRTVPRADLGVQGLCASVARSLARSRVGSTRRKSRDHGRDIGDTGSAAIEGCKRCDNIDIFILHPHERVSEVQRRQMTTVMAPNIHNIAVQGNFDDCQAMVKTSFVAEPFLPDGRRLVAVNSINWARIMAQIVYYFYSALALGRIDRPTSFSYPPATSAIFLRVIWQSRWVCLSKSSL